MACVYAYSDLLSIDGDSTVSDNSKGHFPPNNRKTFRTLFD
jgi:hypothetical protein